MKAQATCTAALTLTTVWGASSATASHDSGELADDVFEVSPTIDLTRGVLAYTTGFSSREFDSVGPITAGSTTVLMAEDLTVDTLEDPYPDSYLFVGIYGVGEERGVVVSLPTDIAASIIGVQTFEQVFPGFTESQILDTFDANLEATFSINNRVDDLLSDYFDPRFSSGNSYAIDFSENSTLVAFSVGAYAGVIVVPEPVQAAVIGIGLAAWVVGRPRRERGRAG